jgi:hypothetical protein
MRIDITANHPKVSAVVKLNENGTLTLHVDGHAGDVFAVLNVLHDAIQEYYLAIGETPAPDRPRPKLTLIKPEGAHDAGTKN